MGFLVLKDGLIHRVYLSGVVLIWENGKEPTETREILIKKQDKSDNNVPVGC